MQHGKTGVEYFALVPISQQIKLVAVIAVIEADTVPSRCF